MKRINELMMALNDGAVSKEKLDTSIREDIAMYEAKKKTEPDVGHTIAYLKYKFMV